MTDVTYEEIIETGTPDPRYLTEVMMLRDQRDQRLQETDHWAYQDRPTMTDEQIAYRQALRDITNTHDSINDVVWPTKPE
jgi:hypothetical protein